MKKIYILLPLAVSVLAAPAQADDKDRRPAAGIQDNSFLIEEAYNQEPGVVQHITTLQRQGRSWFYNFTQEWPLNSQNHQFSYSLPYTWLRSEDQRSHGLGDISLHYRYQARYETNNSPAFAPRLSLIVPTGSRTKGLGDGSFGVEALLPFSKIVSDRVTLHANAGITHLFNVEGHQPTSFLLGGSAIHAVTRDFNFMLEALGEWKQSVNAIQELEREFTFTISPGARYAINLPDNAQLVVGLATPVGFTRGNTPDYGAFLYLSFEHSFLKKK
jgi:hypothetical protein